MMKTYVVGALALLLWLPFACTEQPQSPPGVQQVSAPAPEIELAVLMGRMQLYMNKLYFAGIHNNEPLRDFYIHELEEIMEDIRDGEVTHDGVDISTNIKLFGLDQLEVFEKAIENNEDFKASYNIFVQACNSCHMASKYPFIIIKEPTNPVFDNQVYEVQ